MAAQVKQATRNTMANMIAQRFEGIDGAACLNTASAYTWKWEPDRQFRYLLTHNHNECSAELNSFSTLQNDFIV